MVGANGAGKTTTLRNVSRLVRPTSGTVRFEDHDLRGLQSHEVVELGIVQVPEGRRIFPEMTVVENLRMGLARSARRDRARNMERCFALFPVWRSDRDSSANHVRGRAADLAIARGLMANPRLLLLDEPSLGLSPLFVKSIFEIILQINRQGTTILLVEQNVYQSLRVASRAYVLETGRVVLSGTGAELLGNEHGEGAPADQAGQALVHEWVQFVRRPEVRHRAVFLSDADMQVMERLVQGVDLWLTTPRPPWEACGTSGMKALVNGGLNLSVLDGWWEEAYVPGLGWALLDGDGDHDLAAAERLYELLERDIVPMFYRRDADSSLPLEWLERVRSSKSTLTPRYSTNRVVREYCETRYLPAAMAYRARAAGAGALAAELTEWIARIERDWSGIRILEVRRSAVPGGGLCEAAIALGAIDPRDVRVELYAQDEEPVIMERVAPPAAPMASGAPVFRAALPTGARSSDYTVRVVPHHGALALPLECRLIHWER